VVWSRPSCHSTSCVSKFPMATQDGATPGGSEKHLGRGSERLKRRKQRRYGDSVSSSISEIGPSNNQLIRLRLLKKHSKIQGQLKSPVEMLLHFLEHHTSILQQLHMKTTRNPLPDLPNSSLPGIYRTTVEAGIDRRDALFIARTVVKVLRSKTDSMTGFRATLVDALVNNTCWPVVEWKEGTDVYVLVIFLFTKCGSANWLLHRATQDLENWKCESVSWNVGHLEHLRTLFGGAQHILGMLDWSVKDMINLYCQSTEKKDCKTTEYISPYIH
jgi:hypothetical protein